MKSILIFILFITIARSSSVSLRTYIEDRLENLQWRPTFGSPAKNIFKTVTEDCIYRILRLNERNDELELSQAGFILTISAFACTTDEHLEKMFNFNLDYSDNSDPTAQKISIDCLEWRLKQIPSNYEIFKNLNPSKTDDQCKSEITDYEKNINESQESLKNNINFSSCDSAYYNSTILEPYLTIYIYKKHLSEEKIAQARKNYVEHHRNMASETVECILKKLFEK